MLDNQENAVDLALHYAEKGWAVFPVAPVGAGDEDDGKRPYEATRGHLDATCDPDKLQRLFEVRPDANIGISCSESGLVVVDIDLDIDTADGNASFEAFKAQHNLPETLTQKTPGGGLHLFYRTREAAKYSGKLPEAPGMGRSAGEAKHNGYVLLAPSIAKSKRRLEPGSYEFVADLPIVDAPAWLERKQVSAEAPELHSLKVGALNNDLHEAIGLLRKKRNCLTGYEEFRDLAFALKNAALATGRVDEAREVYKEFALRWELREEDEESVERALRQTYDWADFMKDGKTIKTAFWQLRKLPDLGPSDVEPVVDFDRQTKEPREDIRLTGLAGRIAEVMRQASDRKLRVFPEAAALMAMSALAAPTYVLRGPQGMVSLNLYGLLLGGTGSGKEAARKAADMVLGAAKRGAERLDGAASDRALHRALADQHGALAVTMDEGGLQLGAIKKGQQSHQRALLTLAMSLWGLGLGELKAHKYADTSKNIGAVGKPRLTLMLMSTPEAMLRATGAEDSESGQLNRFLVFKEPGFPPLKDGVTDRDLLQDPPDDIAKACRKFVARDAGFILMAAHNGLPSSQVFEMTVDAATLIERFRKGEVEDNRMKGGTTAESWSRAVEQALRVAGLLALSDAALNGDLSDVACEERHVETAIRIVRRALLGTDEFAKNASKSDMERTKDKIIEAIVKRAGSDGFARARDVKKDVLRGVQRREREEVLKAMIEDGEIILEERAPPQGGRPGEYLAVGQDSDQAGT